MNCTTPLPLICASDTAVPSGQPSQAPPVFTRLLPDAVTFCRVIQRTASPDDGGTTVGDGGAGAGLGAGAGAGPGAGAGAGAGTGAGVGADGETPSRCVGIRTMNTSARFPPRFDVHRKYSPVTSRCPFGRFS